MKPTTTIVGRLGHKETRKISDSIEVTNFSIAINDLYKNHEGQYEAKTHWFNIEAWGPKSKIISNHIKIGQHIAVNVIIETNLSSADPKYQGRIRFIAESISFDAKKSNLSMEEQVRFTAEDIAF